MSAWAFSGFWREAHLPAPAFSPARVLSNRSAFGAVVCRKRQQKPRHALTQVPGTGQTSSHLTGDSPSHSVHFLGLMTKVSPFIEIAAFGHSNSQRLQPVQDEAMIL